MLISKLFDVYSVSDATYMYIDLVCLYTYMMCLFLLRSV